MQRNIFSGEDTKAPFKLSKWLFGALFILILLLIAWIYLPYAIADHIKKVLIENGHTNVKIEDINFHPLAGRLLASNLSFSVKDHYSARLEYLSIEFSWLPLMDKKLNINNVLIKNATFSIQNEDTFDYKEIYDLETIKALKNIFPKLTVKEYSLQTLELYKTNIKVKTKESISNYNLDVIVIQNLKCCASTPPINIEIKAEVDTAPLIIKGALTLFAENPTFKGKINTDNLPLTTYAGLFKQWFTAIDGTISIDSDINIDTTNDQYKIKQSGAIVVEKFSAENKDFHIAEEQLNWNGDSNIVVNNQSKKSAISATGKINGSDFYLTFPEPELTFEHQAFQWQGKLEASVIPDNNLEINITGDITAQNFQISTLKNQLILLSTPKIEISGLNINNTKLITFNTLTANELSIAKIKRTATKLVIKRDALFKNSEVQVSNLQLKDLRDYSINRLLLVNSELYLHRKTDEKWYILDDLTTLLAKNNIELQDLKEPRSAIINKVQFKGATNLVFVDQTVSPNFETDVDFAETEFRDIDTRKPSSVVKINLSGTMNQITKLALTGSIQPFSPNTTIKLNANIDKFPLVAIQQYTKQLTNSEISSGTLHGNIKINIADNLLHNISTLKFSNVHAISPKSIQTTLFEHTLAISLDSAIKLLKNKKDQFAIKVDSKERLDDPNFPFMQQFMGKLGNEVQNAAIKVTKKMFAPYNKGIKVIEAKNNNPAKLALEPVFFSPGNALLNVSAIEYLDKVLAAVNKHSELNIQLCGITTGLDKKVFGFVLSGKASSSSIKKEHIKLANLFLKKHAISKPFDINKLLTLLSTERVRVINNYLLAKKVIDKDRLQICKPYLDDNNEIKPRVDLLLGI